ncbi:hypothetical protein R16034_04672 [Ralstonia edaphis]|uniref:Secreted protein n=1 Tax=Ralstonia edaphi TaxID=3058599 RepID=A0AB72XAI7_9RALS|nr:hypothetical protein R16034_04672 [Ralstonia sp. LMG 6871]
MHASSPAPTSFHILLCTCICELRCSTWLFVASLTSNSLLVLLSSVFTRSCNEAIITMLWLTEVNCPFISFR